MVLVCANHLKSKQTILDCIQEIVSNPKYKQIDEKFNAVDKNQPDRPFYCILTDFMSQIAQQSQEMLEQAFENNRNDFQQFCSEVIDLVYTYQGISGIQQYISLRLCIIDWNDIESVVSSLQKTLQYVKELSTQCGVDLIPFFIDTATMMYNLPETKVVEVAEKLEEVGAEEAIVVLLNCLQSLDARELELVRRSRKSKCLRLKIAADNVCVNDENTSARRRRMRNRY